MAIIKYEERIYVTDCGICCSIGGVVRKKHSLVRLKIKNDEEVAEKKNGRENEESGHFCPKLQRELEKE